MTTYGEGYEHGHDDAMSEVAHDVEELIKRFDPVVLSIFLAWLAGIFISDALFARFRQPRDGAPVTFSGNTRNTWLLRGFFWYLALHMTKRWRWDPLTRLGDRMRRG